MKLTRIDVTDFRKLARVTIERLAPGLNVIVGDNEAGKSTLLAALRAALFERHRVSGQAVEEMQPYGRQTRPTIEIDFAKSGASYRLLKAFGQRPEAQLIGDGKQWQGDAADEELARILAFTRPGRGESKPELHHGVFGMMWVSQGTSHQSPPIDAAREQVASALEREVGAVAGGEHGRVLLALAEERFDQFWDSRRRPRGDYRKAIDALAALQSRRDEAGQRLSELDADIDNLGEVRLRLETYDAEGTIEHHRQMLRDAGQAVAALQGLQQQVANAKNALDFAERAHTDAVQRRSARQDLQQAARQAAVTLDEARAAQEMTHAFLTRADAGAEAARAAAEEAMRAEQAAAQASQALQSADAARRLRNRATAGSQQLAAAEDFERKRLDALAVIAANAIDVGAVAKLDELATALRDATSRLESAGVRLELRPQFGGAAEVDGAIIDDGELVIARDTTVHLFGYGEIHVRPGGGVADLEHAVEAARRELGATLIALGQPDMDSARAAWERRRAAEQELPFLNQSLAGLAPEGLDRLRQELAALKAELARLPSPEHDVSPDEIEAARRAHRDAAEAAGEARRKAEAASHATHDARSALAVATERLTAAERTEQQVRGSLTAARLVAADTELDEQEQAATEAVDTARAAHAAASTVLDGAEPDVAILRRNMAQNALDGLLTSVEDLKGKRIALEASLQARGREGLGEQLAELDDQITLEAQQLARSHVEAQAAALLHDTLVQAHRETKERWLRPIYDRAGPYLELLHTGSEVVLDEDTMEISALRRNDEVEPFVGLSMGAREQVAVITRLALADLLSEAGHTSCLVLDDPLVNADQRRLERMHLVLHKAAERHQILILTCRERDYLGLGGQLVRL